MTYLYIHPFRLKCRSCMCTWSPHTVSRVGIFCSQQYARAAQMVQQSQAWFMPAAISGLYKSGVLLSRRVFMLGSRASNFLIASGHCWPLFSPGSHRSESSQQDSYITACFSNTEVPVQSQYNIHSVINYIKYSPLARKSIFLAGLSSMDIAVSACMQIRITVTNYKM